MTLGSIYLDHSATTPLAPEVRLAMQAALADETGYGNPSSVHKPGRHARHQVEAARARVAALLGCDAEEIVFTSGGSEANYLALRGLARGLMQRAPAEELGVSGASSSNTRRVRGRLVVSPIEHPSLAGAAQILAEDGWQTTRIAVDEEGGISETAFTAALGSDPGPVIASVALANHELGNLYDVARLVRLAHARSALVHSDLVQAVGRVPVDVRALGVDAASLSAHKLYGPKGVGALYVRAGVRLEPLWPGGHQEYERRPGTENVLGIIGMGVACELAAARLREDSARIARLRDDLEARLLAIPGARRHGREPRVPGMCNVGFADVPGDRLVIALDLEGVFVSAGAACTSGSQAVSPVLAELALAAGRPPTWAREGVRFSLGRATTGAEIARAAATVERVIGRIRAAALTYARRVH